MIRCYNGAFDSESQKMFENRKKEEEKLIKELSKEYPNITCVYFPYGEFYQTFSNYKPIGEEKPTAIEALKSVAKQFHSSHTE